MGIAVPQKVQQAVANAAVHELMGAFGNRMK